MAKTWVLVAESSRARIFSTDRPTGPLQELDTLTNPAARMHEKDLISDLPGRAADHAGRQLHPKESKTTHKDQETIQFAKIINQRLNKGRMNGNFEKLVLVAGPSFLGLLRKSLNPDLLKLVNREIDKNLTQLPAQELRKHLPEWL